MITPDPAAVFNVGRVTSYADAVKGGYTGTREDWERDLAALGTTAAEVEANRQAVAEDKAAVEGDVTTVGEYKEVASAAAAAALQSAESAHTDALAATAAKEDAQTAQGIAEEARADAVSAKGAAESAQTEANASASAATEAALAAGDAAQTATSQAGAASDSATAAAQSAEAAAESARTLTIDTTLTQTGQAADAKKTGEGIADLKSAINYDNNILYSVGTVPSEWEQGTLYPSSGGKQANVKRLRTVSAFFLTDEVIIKVNEGYQIALYAYSGTDSTYYGIWNGSTFEKSWYAFQKPIQTASLPKTYRYKIVLLHVDDTAITEMSISESSNCIAYSEKYLPKSNYEADKINYAFNTSKSLTDGMLPHFTFTRGNIGSSGQKTSSTTVCRTTTAVKFDEDTFIRCINSEYKYALRRYSGENIISDNFIDYLGDFEGTYRLKANTYYAITLAKRTPETVMDLDEYAEQLEIWSPAYLEEMKKYEINRFAPSGNTRRKIYAHKGITQNAPENTVPSFEAAGAGGAWAIETDIQATSDGYLICMHDTTVDRTTDGTGSIASMTMAEIDQLRIKNHPDLKVPTVEQYLGICKTYGCVPCMELKNVASSQEMITKLLQIITDYGLESTAVILCSQYSIGYVQCINPKIRCVFIIDPTNLERWITHVQRYFNVSVTIASGTYTVTHDIIKQLHAAGLAVNVGDVNDVEEIKGYFAMGADSVSSDFISTY